MHCVSQNTTSLELGGPIRTSNIGNIGDELNIGESVALVFDHVTSDVLETFKVIGQVHSIKTLCDHQIIALFRKLWLLNLMAMSKF